MAFADAVFDGHAILDGVGRYGLTTWACETRARPARRAPVYVAMGPLSRRFSIESSWMLGCEAFRPGVQRDFADLRGLGPDLVPGPHADLVVETSWERVARSS